MPPHISSYELSERATTRATSRMKGHVKSAKSPKQPTPDIRSMFAPSTSMSQGGIALSKQQQLQVRLEDRRQSFTNERDAAIEAKRIKVAAEESEFEANEWRRAWDKANATKMAAREVKRREHHARLGSTPSNTAMAGGWWDGGDAARVGCRAPAVHVR